MPSDYPVIQCLTDILDNIARIQRYVADLNCDELAQDNLRLDAVERCLSRLSEAASRLGARAEALIPDQPWRDIRGFGNWLRHAYHDVSIDVLWNAIHRDLPSLQASVKRAVECISNVRD